MRFEKFSFGSIRIDGVTHEHNVVIDYGTVRKRKKKPSKQFRETFGHTPLSVEEKIPWEERGSAPQNQTGHSADAQSYKGAERELYDDQRGPAHDLLTDNAWQPIQYPRYERLRTGA